MKEAELTGTPKELIETAKMLCEFFELNGIRSSLSLASMLLLSSEMLKRIPKDSQDVFMKTFLAQVSFNQSYPHALGPFGT